MARRIDCCYDAFVPAAHSIERPKDRKQMIVLKFGGTSVRNAAYIDKCLDIAVRRIEHAPVLVFSAMSGVTDALIELAALSGAGDADGAGEVLSKLRSRHFSVLDSFGDAGPAAETRRALTDMFDQLESLSRGLLLLRECSSRTLDAITAFGELMSTTLVAFRAIQRNIDCTFIDARTVIRTDESFTAAVPDMAATRASIRAEIKPEPDSLVVTQGFIGATAAGATTTLGRGGSDYSATLIGAALGAREVQIWTDVHGIMTCDPRIVPEARTVAKISYAEAAELAYFGAKVVHPSSIQPAIDESIPVLVKNTSDPDGACTAIVDHTLDVGVRAIAGKKSVTLVNITSSRMLNAYGFLRRIFDIFEACRTSVDLIATSEVSVSVTVDDTRALDTIVTDLRQVGSVSTEQGLSIVSLVGQDLWKDSAFVAEVFQELRSVPIRMISLGASDINLSTVVPDESFFEAIRKLHSRFFGPG